MYYVYILRSISNPEEIYTRYTHDLKHRLKEHNCGLSLYTKKYLPWDLVFYAAFKQQRRAEKFESYLKTGSGRAFLRKHLLEPIPSDSLHKLAKAGMA